MGHLLGSSVGPVPMRVRQRPEGWTEGAAELWCSTSDGLSQLRGTLWNPQRHSELPQVGAKDPGLCVPMLVSHGCGLPLEGSMTYGEAPFFRLHKGLAAAPVAEGRRPSFLKVNLVAHHSALQNAPGLRTALRPSCREGTGRSGVEAAVLTCQVCTGFVPASVCSSLLPQSLNTSFLHLLPLHVAQDSHQPRVCMTCRD